MLKIYRLLSEGNPPAGLNEILGDSNAIEAILIRVMEVFSERFGFTHVYRGGSLNNLKGGLSGTFTFDPEEAKSYVSHSHSGKREKPCLFALPVSSIVDFYKKNKGNVGLWAEHGLDEVFNHSFDIYMDEHIPDDLTVYILESENTESDKDGEIENEVQETEEKRLGLRKKMRMKGFRNRNQN